MRIKICPSMQTEMRGESLYDEIFAEDIVQYVIPVYSFSYPHKTVYARGISLENGFIVLKGSLAAVEESSKLSLYHKKLRKKLTANGVLEMKGYSLEFTKPYLLKNEYEATSVISGNNKCRICSGVWKDGQKRTPLENKLMGITEFEINL